MEILVCASLYLASKINEIDTVRIRDFVNVTMYCVNEFIYVEKVTNDATFVDMPSQEIEDGILLIIDQDDIFKLEQKLIRLLNYDLSSRTIGTITDMLS